MTDMFQRPMQVILKFALLAVVAAGALISACDQAGAKQETASPAQPSPSATKEPELMKATFGSGCFWCTEAIFENLEGVESVESGYSGGDKPDPTYEEVCSGETGHAEVVQITYDPNVVPYEKLLEVFFKTHDPTTLNRQGADHGTQYRSAIFFHNDEQRAIAERIKKALDESGAYPRPIVTEIIAAKTFYPAEEYHQDYFRKNPNAGYCQFSIRPKLDKFKKAFAESLKSDSR